MSTPASTPLARSFAASLALAAGVLLGPASHAARIDVGTGPGCEAATLPIALGLALPAGADEIRLSQTVSYTNISQALVNWDAVGAGPLTISGGWANCQSGTQGTRTLVSGNGTDPVFSVEATAGRGSEVTFEWLEIVGGGRGISASGASDVELMEVTVRDNGGGLRATTGANIYINVFSAISENGPALLGGGIYCSDPGSEITLRGLVAHNEASAGGGGIFGQSACAIHLHEGAWVDFNEAPLGAGVYIQSGAVVDGTGSGTLGVRVFGNTASNEGGGFYVTSAGSSVFLGNTRVEQNSAVSRGGGVSAVNGGDFRLERFAQFCFDPPRCATLRANFLTDGGNGSAVYAGTSGDVTLLQAFVEHNTGPASAGFVLFAEDVGTEMYLEGVQIWDNRTVSLFEAQDSAVIVAGFVSAAGNNYLVGGVPPLLDSRGGQSSGGAEIELYSSILVDQRPFVANTGTIDGDCLILDTDVGLTSSSGEPMVGIDPRFRNPATGNLRLRLDSPAIDSCDTVNFTPLDSDYDLDARGYDLLSHPNTFGAFDRGADELRPLFADGFETGNTSAWSTSVP